MSAVIGMVAASSPVRAEVTAQTDQGFVSRNAAVLDGTPAAIWKRLTTPAQWWSGDHTFSGDAANLTLDPVPGGCFCEVLPGEAPVAAKAAKPGVAARAPARGGVAHMRVVFVDRGRALRMVGALGPLQSEAVTGVLTVTLKPVEGGTRVIFEYVVGGYMRYPRDKIAPAVDTVMSDQLNSLARGFGPVAAVAAPGVADPAQPPAPAPAPEAPAAPRGLGKQGLLLPRGRIWSLPPSQSALAPSAAPLPVVPLAVDPVPAARLPQPQEPAPAPAPVPVPVPPLPTALLPADGVASGGEAAVAAPSPVATPAPPKRAVTTKKPTKAPKPPEPARVPVGPSSDEPSKDSINSVFDAVVGGTVAPAASQ
ncbi:SRPBCC domain-containing protein [Novosphingobium sp.]|uniref:SRPBCC family protein n=1 Tax=Novosphingobium sp. TaxID=1874826 RepID=UPI00333ED5B2